MARNSEAPELPREARIPMPEPEQQLSPTIPTIASDFAKKRNGPDVKDPRSTVVQAAAQFDEMRALVDRLEQELKQARLRISQLELQITEIEGTRNTIESRINTCVMQRDQAVTETGELRGVLNSIAAICAKYHDAPQD